MFHPTLSLMDLFRTIYNFRQAGFAASDRQENIYISWSIFSIHNLIFKGIIGVGENGRN